MRTGAILPRLGQWPRARAASHHDRGGAADRGFRRGARTRPPLGRAPAGARIGAADAGRLRAWPTGRRRVTHSRRFTATGAGTRVDEEVEWATGGPAARRLGRPAVLRRGSRPMQAHLDAYAAAAAERALEVVQVVGAAVIEGGRVLVARRAGGPYDGCWEFPGGKVEPGESDAVGAGPGDRRGAGHRRRAAGLPRRGRARRVGRAGARRGPRPCGCGGAGSPGERPWRASTPSCAGCGSRAWTTLDWIAADRPLLPAVRPHLR